jgi:hypothetical protein
VDINEEPMVADSAFGDGGDVETHDTSGDTGALEGGDVGPTDSHVEGSD